MQTPLGMVWLTSDKRIRDAGLIPADNIPIFLDACDNLSQKLPVAQPLFESLKSSHLNIGSIELNGNKAIPINTEAWFSFNSLNSIYERCVIISEDQYGAIANNLTEVYTSISIDSKTGTARPGALYAYEGVPRSSVFFFDIGFLNPKSQGIEKFITERKTDEFELNGNFTSLIKIVESGLSKIRVMGIGGKRSHGFGRMDIFPITQLSDYDASTDSGYEITPNRPSVFLGHSNKDKLFVRRLAKDLQVRQIGVWLDEREILVGDSIATKINEGIQKMDFMILVLSKAAIESGWVEREVNAGLVKEAERKNVVILPILIEHSSETQIPPLLKDKKYANFVKDYENGLHELIYSIRGHQERFKQSKR